MTRKDPKKKDPHGSYIVLAYMTFVDFFNGFHVGEYKTIYHTSWILWVILAQFNGDPPFFCPGRPMGLPEHTAATDCCRRRGENGHVMLHDRGMVGILMVIYSNPYITGLPEISSPRKKPTNRSFHHSSGPFEICFPC